MAKTKEELQKQYAALSMQVGDRVNKQRILQKDLEGIYGEIDTLNAEFGALVKADDDAKAAAQATAQEEAAAKIAAAQDKRGRKTELRAVSNEPGGDATDMPALVPDATNGSK